MTDHPEVSVATFNDTVVLVCDECGDINHYASETNIWELWDDFNDHIAESHSGMS